MLSQKFSCFRKKRSGVVYVAVIAPFHERASDEDNTALPCNLRKNLGRRSWEFLGSTGEPVFTCCICSTSLCWIEVLKQLRQTNNICTTISCLTNHCNGLIHILLSIDTALHLHKSKRQICRWGRCIAHTIAMVNRYYRGLAP